MCPLSCPFFRHGCYTAVPLQTVDKMFRENYLKFLHEFMNSELLMDKITRYQVWIPESSIKLK